MELKRDNAGNTEPELPTFNRTSMELKHHLKAPIPGINELLIEPVWN